jgi:hypothetical protein
MKKSGPQFPLARAWAHMATERTSGRQEQEKGKGLLARQPTCEGERDRHARDGGMRKQR